MQFHLEGFMPGDPRMTVAAPDVSAHSDKLPERLDVLIVGCGPAGLTLAAQLSAFADLRVAIVEQKGGPIELGQADGIACRTMEMFEAFGFAERVRQEACWINEVTFWKPDGDAPDRIVRHGRVRDTPDGLSEFPHVVLNQARVHDFWLDVMRRSPRRLQPHYSHRLLDLVVDTATADDPEKVSPGHTENGAIDDHRVTVRLERTDPAHAGEIVTVQARHVVGCDGARSTVRKAIGQQLRGDSSSQVWGVMDLLAVTDFPDIRFKSAVQSSSGNLLVIPREGGHLVRLYVELDPLAAGERVRDRGITLDHLIATARAILHPYRLQVKEVPWWSVYEIGQRICDRYDDVPAGGEATRLPRVFIAGDACHTHSPKAGQGMNVSMQDSFNLGWKLAAVLRGQCVPEVLHTYTRERRAVAQELIDFDREWARMFSDRPRGALAAAPGGAADRRTDAHPGDGGVDPKEFQAYFERHGRFTAGVETHYPPALLCGASTHQSLAAGFTIGMRFHSAPVMRVCDARQMELGHVARADGRWRLYAFGTHDDVLQDGSGLHRLCRFLDESPASPVRRYTRPDEDPDAVFDLRVIVQAAHTGLDVHASGLPILLPAKGRYRLIDYEKVFSARLTKGETIFEHRGIDRTRGALVVVRPDQYVAHVLPLDAHEELAAFFDRFMLARP